MPAKNGRSSERAKVSTYLTSERKLDERRVTYSTYRHSNVQYSTCSAREKALARPALSTLTKTKLLPEAGGGPVEIAIRQGAAILIAVRKGAAILIAIRNQTAI